MLSSPLGILCPSPHNPLTGQQPGSSVHPGAVLLLCGLRTCLCPRAALLLVPDKVRELERNCSETLEQRDRVVLCVIIKKLRTSLVVQWLRVCLPVQGVWEDSWSGKIPRAAGQLSLCAATTEPSGLEPLLHHKRNQCSEKPENSQTARKGRPHWLQLEKARTQQ